MDVALTAGELHDLEADALVLVHFTGEPLGPVAAAADHALGGLLQEVRTSGEASPDFPSRLVVPTMGRLPVARVALVALGPAALLDGYRLRNALELCGRQLKRTAARVAVALEPQVVAALGGDRAAALRGVVEGLGCANSETDRDRATPRHPGTIASVVVMGLSPDEPGLEQVAREASLLGAATATVRSWQWRPSNRFTPQMVASEAVALARETGLESQVLEPSEMASLGMGSLLSVARGSHEPARLIVLRYRGTGGAASGTELALVGKGITFDSGGISLKPAAGMATMKADMSGGAAVINAMGVIAQLRPSIPVIGVVPLTENMPGGRATKPGDVVTAMNGTTIEITNTDAEGRLVLADALAYAIRLGATHLVDVATLTGAVSVALGHPVTGAMGNDPTLLGQVFQAADRAGERIWQLPMFPEHDVVLESDVADIKNAAETRAAGSINGAVFLRCFVGERPWVHLDIAGAAWNDQPGLARLAHKGPTGAMTRTLIHLPFVIAG
ncbi:MAG TPA: leucyl aminopeptidase [Verrucomicrobiae bacterium]|nr:leucyl aminopeptidase [Verrucomicrobiae bacterium]